MGITGDWDRQISRRTLLRTGGTLAAGAALSGTIATTARATPPVAGDPFSLGVASGDPTADGFALWTRLAPQPLAADGGMPAIRQPVRYEIALDEHFRSIVRRGAVVTGRESAHSVHVDVDGLLPGGEYFYRFKWGRAESRIGRTRTAPPSWWPVRELRFAFVSCQNWANGLFTVYQDLVARDPELVVHLGDYIYEGPGGAAAIRQHAPAVELMSLADYRIRYAQYRTDPDLQTAHAALPWLVTWDDAEVANNYAGFDDDPDVPLADFAARRAAAYQAYYEHMPLRRASRPRGPHADLYRRFSWGRLATFNILDGRQYRSDQPLENSPKTASGYTESALDPNRTMLGDKQMNWLARELATSRSGWNILANQVAFAPFDRDEALDARDYPNTDNWDGYVADRQRILDALARHHTPNPIVITGASHNHWVRNVPPNFTDFDAPPVATEFMGTSVSTAGDPNRPSTTFGDDPNNPHVLMRNNNRGYAECRVTPREWTSEFRTISTVTRPGGTTSTLATFAVENGKPGAVRV